MPFAIESKQAGCARGAGPGGGAGAGTTGTHLFYRRAFEPKKKNLARDFSFLAQMLSNWVLQKARFIFFSSYEKKNIYLIC